MDILKFDTFSSESIYLGDSVSQTLFVAPALAGRHRRASFRRFVRSSIRPSVHPSTFNMGIL